MAMQRCVLASGTWVICRLISPLATGFDHYFGIPYSNDMDVKKSGHPPIPLLRDESIVEKPAKQETLTLRYTREALSFIRSHQVNTALSRSFSTWPIPFLTFRFMPARRFAATARADYSAMPSRKSIGASARSSPHFAKRDLLNRPSLSSPATTAPGCFSKCRGDLRDCFARGRARRGREVFACRAWLGGPAQ